MTAATFLSHYRGPHWKQKQTEVYGDVLEHAERSIACDILGQRILTGLDLIPLYLALKSVNFLECERKVLRLDTP